MKHYRWYYSLLMTMHANNNAKHIYILIQNVECLKLSTSLFRRSVLNQICPSHLSDRTTYKCTILTHTHTTHSHVHIFISLMNLRYYTIIRGSLSTIGGGSGLFDRPAVAVSMLCAVHQIPSGWSRFGRAFHTYIYIYIVYIDTSALNSE